MHKMLFHATLFFACLATFSLSGMNVAMRLSLWDDVIESNTGQSEIELQEQESRVPMSWLEKYPILLSQAYGDYSTALRTLTGKFDMKGCPLYVWHDYVSGTNPMNTNDIFRAIISVHENEVSISWAPRLSAEEEAKRIYTIYGKSDLLATEDDWTPLMLNEDLLQYHFFKVGVRMK